MTVSEQTDERQDENEDLHDEVQADEAEAADEAVEAEVVEEQDEVADLCEQIADLKDQLLRERADFDNIRKRRQRAIMHVRCSQFDVQQRWRLEAAAIIFPTGHVETTEIIVNRCHADIAETVVGE